jgi:NAD(P)H-flavin reductase
MIDNQLDISEKIPYKIVEINNLNHQISEITLIPEKNKVSFLPGQYVYIYYNDLKKLPYSIASSPNEDYIKLLIFHGTNLENINFFEKNLGNLVNISQACGNAYYRKNNNNKIIAIGKDLGISPIKSMVDYLVFTHSDQKILLYYISRAEEELVLDSYFNNILISNKQVDIDYYPVIITDKRHLSTLHSSLLLLHNKPDLLKKSDFYVFGSNDFVLNSYKIYQDLGCADSRFFTDAKLN